MKSVSVSGLSPAEVRNAVGGKTYAKGLDYVHSRAVRSIWWDAEANALRGRVRGRLEEFYETTVYLSSAGDRAEYVQGECSCPVMFDCKHAAALVLEAIESASAPSAPVIPQPTLPGVQQPKRRRPPVVQAPSWERSLALMLGANAATGDRGHAAPLAIELSLSTSPSPYPAHHPTSDGPRLMARVVKQGKSGWVRGNLSWGTLSNPYGEFVAAHAQVLKELYASYNSRGGHFGYYGNDKLIDLSDFDSRQLWPLLDQALSVGVRLVYSKKARGDLDPYGAAEFTLDVTNDASDDSLVVRPAIQVAPDGDGPGRDAVVLGFVGAEGHGLIWADRAELAAAPDPAEVRFRLARLSPSVPPGLQQAVLAGQEIRIPSAEAARFRAEFYPQLRQVATVRSSDGSFSPPVISGPQLSVQAEYGDGHVLDLSWSWLYQVDESEVRVPLGSGSSEIGLYRDPDKEDEILTDLDLGEELRPESTLRGLETLQFSTELLPRLSAQPSVDVVVSGTPVDYREAGDSLTIGVSTSAPAGETDWFDLGITITVEGAKVPFVDVFRALTAGQSYLLLLSGAYFSLDKPELQTLRTLIEEARALQDSPGDSLKISRYQVGLWDELEALGVVGRQAKAWNRQLAALRTVDSADRTELPATIQGSLRPYQLDGFRWLAFLWKFGLGGILADDMGLGKTLQTLTLIAHAKATEATLAPFLIIAPTSVVSNWPSEAAKFAPGLKVVTISDTLRRRGQTLAEAVGDADVVVTSYTLLRLDIDAYADRSWSGLILDEAQFAKNHQSKLYQACRRLPAPFKLAITGTPMENNLMELWSLLSITSPGLFPSPSRFDEYYARPIEKQGDSERLAQLRRRIKPLVKRRTKEQVAADLPDKQQQVIEVELHPRHRKLYQTHLQRERQKVLGLVGDLDKNRFTIFRSLTLLRQLSLHAGLVDDAHRGLPSAKIEALLEQLPDIIGSGHRAVIFSQFTGFLDLVRQRLDADGVEYCYLDGSTRNRPAVLKRFKDGDAPLFLISLKAGGVGLNLTEADYCFLLDPWWNPATEAQAVDRIHRIGQHRTVMVYRLIAKDTIEQKVMELKARKAALFASVMDEGNTFGTGLSADDIRGLFS
ncbi:DEAD/DEAH box helicase [Kribbella albertanoniae]|uniref:Helicase n=1 Tax=Kribbella albertanoniae TaxID=1266829 RepID=A0A4V2XQV1_9ACTN|nr:DEAD/DEAH box helicase [Kribbella albertanoniae]TDC27515.1 helicase [Kribbella albertanoniae]